MFDNVGPDQGRASSGDGGHNDRGRALLWGESGSDFTALATNKIMKIG